MTHHHGFSRTPPRTSLTSSYSYGYSPTSEDAHRLFPGQRQEAVAPLSQLENGPISPPIQLLAEEYALAFRVPTQTSNEDQRQSFDVANADPMDMHLLLETATNDCQNFRVLSLEDLDTLKKEEVRLGRLIEAGKKKLYLESKMDSTSRLLQKLSTNGSNATSPTSPLSSKRSFLRFRTSGTSNTDAQSSQGDAGSGSARFQELAKEVWRLEKRHTELRQRKLEHTAAMLHFSNQQQPQNEGLGQQEPSTSYSFGDGQFLQLPSDLDGNLEGFEWQSIARARLPQINNELHGLLARDESQNIEASAPPPPNIDLEPAIQFDYLENSLGRLSESHRNLRQLVNESRNAREGQGQRLRESHSVLTRLWDMVGAIEQNPHGNSALDVTRGAASRDLDAAEANLSAPFSSQALSTKVENLCSQAIQLMEQHNALNYQLDQEREARHRSKIEGAAEQARLTEQLQEAYNQHLVGQNSLRDVQSKLKAAELRLKETQVQVKRTKQDCEVKQNEELTQERNLWKSREHDLSARLASKVTEVGLLRTAISEKEGKIAELQAAEAATTAEFNEADHQIETLGANLLASENRLAKFESAETDSKRIIEQLTWDKEHQMAELALLRDEVAKITANLIAAEGHLTEYESAAQECARQITGLDDSKKLAESEVSHLTVELGVLIKRVQEAESNVLAGNTESQDIRRRILELSSAKDLSGLELDRLRTEMVGLKAALKIAEERAATFETTSRQWSKYASELESHRQSLEHEISQSQEDVIVARTRVEVASTAKEEELEALKTKYMDLLQDFKDSSNAQTETSKALQVKTRQVEDLRKECSELSQEMIHFKVQTGSSAHNHADLESQLETSLASHRETEARMRNLEKELRDLVQDYEHLVRTEVEAEREREVLVQTLEAQRERIEELLFQLDEERVQTMGKRTSGSSHGDQVNGITGDSHGGDVRRSTEGISMGVMRNEFKRMMREARADHYRRLKVCRWQFIWWSAS